ncbi:small acid-soluble spore protein N [Shouchella lonarensis]|uniref:Small acid-soluble spore protein N (Minor) n=1 Tax=Shouchella lonarensis TaxID=1464122 RepID=A0A1G6HBN7_9BACI|nr:small acid-soluble spore protein N [Shouchella lonarensis]SDB91680.1 small acid-soluble spore protein N (minor) [Shouchella lonarensis]
MGEKNGFAQFTPDHLGEQSRTSNRNNGKKMASKSNHQPDYVPPKG